MSIRGIPFARAEARRTWQSSMAQNNELFISFSEIVEERWKRGSNTTVVPSANYREMGQGLSHC